MIIVVAWSTIAIAAALVSGLLALAKRRDPSAWLAWGFLFPPAVLLFLITPRNTGARPRQPSLDQLDAAF